MKATAKHPRFMLLLALILGLLMAFVPGDLQEKDSSASGALILYDPVPDSLCSPAAPQGCIMYNNCCCPAYTYNPCGNYDINCVRIKPFPPRVRPGQCRRKVNCEGCQGSGRSDYSCGVCDGCGSIFSWQPVDRNMYDGTYIYNWVRRGCPKCSGSGYEYHASCRGFGTTWELYECN